MRRSCLLVLVLAASLSPAAWAQKAQGWAVHAGTFDTADDPTPELGIEYRFVPFKIKGVPFIPALGAAATEDKNAWVYGGVRYDWNVSKHWVLTPNFAVALYEAGDGKDLGGPIEFRSGLEVSYRFNGGSRLGLLFYHMSNNDYYDPNPGSNSLVVKWGH